MDSGFNLKKKFKNVRLTGVYPLVANLYFSNMIYIFRQDKNKKGLKDRNEINLYSESLNLFYVLYYYFAVLIFISVEHDRIIYGNEFYDNQPRRDDSDTV